MGSGTLAGEREAVPFPGEGGLRLLANVDFDTMVRDNSARLYAVAFNMLGNAQEAEEAVQDIFLEAYKSLPGFRGESALSTWLYSIAMNVLADRINSRKRTPRVVDRPEAGGRFDNTESAEADYLRKASVEEIRRAVLKLPARQRAVFTLNVIEGYSHKEIARIMGISPGAARVLRVRAAKRIRKELS